MKILFITPHVPYPLNNGGLIRVHHLVANLARRHEVVMLCLEPDNEEQAAGIKVLENYGISVHTQPVKKHQLKANKRRYQLLSLFTKQAYQHFKYYSASFQKAIDKQLLRGDYDLLMVELSQMGYYNLNTKLPRFIDLQNVEYEIMERTFRTEKNWLRKLLARSEWRKFYKHEIENCKKFTACLTTSQRDADILQSRSSEIDCHVIPNGVDSDYFSPSQRQDSTQIVQDPNLVLFTGTISYYPNTEGLLYFVNNIWPLITAQNPAATFCIAGKSPPPEIEKLAAQDKSIIVTGMVDDMREYYTKAAVVVVPLRVGGGTRLKILEAMAMKRALVSTTVGAEGIDYTDGENILIKDTPQEFADSVVKLMQDNAYRTRLEENGRLLVDAKYDWRAVADKLCDVFEAAYYKKNAKLKLDADFIDPALNSEYKKTTSKTA